MASTAPNLDSFDPLFPFRIQGLPPTMYYIPNFISAEEEASILSKIPSQRWVTLSHRRLQAHPSTLTNNNTLLGALLPSYLVKPVVERFNVFGVFKNTPHKEPNHVLINEYKRGEGIMPHEDGAAYSPVVATVSLGAPICLEITSKPAKLEEHRSGGESEIQGVTNGPSPEPTSEYNIPTRILQEPRSLLITTSSAYSDLLHGISSIEVDENLSPDTIANWSLLAEPYLFKEGRNKRRTRVSLTYRDVLKVSSAARKVLGGLSKR
ncbi:hypothetical protein BCR34DRAFT_478673 [Clohesyomyces aquaticus]|uniref:Fe2OG dioxygenase domain-containing protein n=1 Tax=Clohesyomyces aquaticus TaxID=1231657 RepID=A0A1Y1ZXA5_9PLEO|nr:hypothetical protein BCR34DRAFT_478673 [Clohesyomyces aquaticus]